jgi:hypothetical protein
MKFLVEVQDNGNNWKVLKAFTWENVALAEGGTYIEIKKDIVWEEMAKQLKAGNPVFLPKGLTRDYTLSDIILPLVGRAADPLAVPKQAAKIKGWETMINRLSYDTIIHSYVFMIENMRMLEKGYFIHDDNREEQYLEIINTGDGDLISLLESYLEAKDDIIWADRYHRRHKDFLAEIDEAKNLDEIKQAVDVYVSTFD